MADNTDETNKKGARPGEPPAPKRPFATLDLKATEVSGEGRPASATDKTPPSLEGRPQASGAGSPDDTSSGGTARAKSGSMFGAGLMRSLARSARRAPLLTHLAAGAVGGLIVLVAAYALAPEPAPAPARGPDVGELTRRVAEIEGVLGTRPGTAGLRARVDEMSRNVAALGNTQAKLAREAKDLEERIGSGKDAPSELAGRISRLEQTAAMQPLATDQAAGQGAPPAALSAKLAELERAAQSANEVARAAAARAAADLAAVRTEAGRLGQRIDGLRGEVEERMAGAARAADFAPMAKRLAALEQELQGYVKDDAGRRADAGRVVVALELAALRRAVDRGDSYTAELGAVKAAAGDQLKLTALERHMREGVAPVRELDKSFRGVANAMLDAEADHSDATLVERLISSARSIVRVRKTGHSTDDVSAEAVIGRVEAALKEGRLAEVIEQGKRLPPKAALAAEEWLKRVEARHSVDKAMADVEAKLKASLAPAGAGSGPQR
jgi:hypothetical protein